MTDRGEADGERKSGSAFAPRLSFGLWEPINPTSRAIRLTELSAVWCSDVWAGASAHSRGQMQFGCHRRAYFWTSVACMSIIHAFHDYVRMIMLISPPFHLRWLSARLHYQRGGDSVQNDSIRYLVTALVGTAFLWDVSVRKKKQNSAAVAWNIHTRLFTSVERTCILAQGCRTKKGK